MRESGSALVAVRRVPLGARSGVVVAVSGWLDVASVAGLRELLTALVAVSDPPDVIVDAGGLVFCDEGVVRALVLAYRSGRLRGGRLVVCGAHGMLSDLLRRTHVDSIVEGYPTVAAAVAALSE
ncbi:MAG TPA: STAS domain-containing protein [Nonomuraea sp.]|nr:STAS domain-containing protein [Nonomuraea sp.]